MLRRAASNFVPFSNRFYRLTLQKQTKVIPTCFALGRNYQINLLAPYSQTMTSPVTPEMNLNFQEIVQLIDEKSIVLIDVREPKELQENGLLPNSVNIPVGDLKSALESLSPEAFQKKYGIPLPDKDASVVFSCHAGGRSMKALLTALELGYKNAKHYAGGFSDWKQNTQNPQ